MKLTQIKQFALGIGIALSLTACCQGDQCGDDSSSSNQTSAEKSKELISLVNQYRQEKGLPIIPTSVSLNKVAATHVQDVQNNHPDKGKCNLHSWSDKGNWSPCCYTSDHAKAQCMWDKPREITSYTGNGYEISASYSANMTPAKGLSIWKKSKSHNEVIINEGIWKDNDWKAVGAAVSANNAVVWFGKEADPN